MIETERLLLRAFDHEDLDIITELYSDEEIMKYMPVPIMDREQARAHLSRIVEDWKKVPQTNFEMAVITKNSQKKVGRTEICVNYDEDSAMIGWLLLKNEWGKGYATEITKSLIAYCFHVLGVHRVFALCHPDNTGSWKVMEKCGMRREAHYIQKCKYVKAEGIRWEDELEYAVVKNEM